MSNYYDNQKLSQQDRERHVEMVKASFPRAEMNKEDVKKLQDQIWYALCYVPEDQALIREYADKTVYPQIAKFMLKDRKEIKVSERSRIVAELEKLVAKATDGELPHIHRADNYWLDEAIAIVKGDK